MSFDTGDVFIGALYLGKMLCVKTPAEHEGEKATAVFYVRRPTTLPPNLRWFEFTEPVLIVCQQYYILGQGFTGAGCFRMRGNDKLPPFDHARDLRVVVNRTASWAIIPQTEQPLGAAKR